MSSNGGSNINPLQPAQRLRALLRQDGILCCPGVFDGFTARIALNNGFKTLYMTGAGTTMSKLGQPDLGIATMNDMHANASMIANLDPTIPLIADADTGFGGAINVGRTVAAYMRSGVAALHLEDQVVNKRCGHLKGKQLVDSEEFISRINAAVMAREKGRETVGADIVIIARTDALQSFGYEEAITRLKKAIAAGADVAFLEGLETKEQCQQACRDLAPTPVLFNSVPGGVSPDLSVEDAETLGFKIIIFPGMVMEVVYDAVNGAMSTLKTKGVPGRAAKLSSPRELFEVCGLKEAMAFDAQAGGSVYAKGV